MVQLFRFILHIPLNLFEIESKKKYSRAFKQAAINAEGVRTFFMGDFLKWEIPMTTTTTSTTSTGAAQTKANAYGQERIKASP